MDLTKLFETQNVLDQHIVKEKGLEGRDLFEKKKLSLLTELGELANELPEEFKFWSNKKNNYENALKEFVDGLHFILSIGNDINIEPRRPIKLISFSNNVVGQFNSLFHLIGSWDQVALIMNEEHYHTTLNNFLHLGEMLGFTWEQIEEGYYAKNKINHERQNTGY